jgi:hypothetical protein
VSEPRWSFGDSPTSFEVKKYAVAVPVSCCLLDDVECDHPKAPPLTRRTRLRWWLADRWDRRPRVHFGPCDHEDCM